MNILTWRTICRTIAANRPGEQFVLTGSTDDYTAASMAAGLTLDWLASTTPPTWADVADGVSAMQVAEAATAATASDQENVSAALVSAQLAAVPIPRDQVAPILQSLLGEASAAILFFETYAHDPSMTAQQWTDFQALDQTTKDRLLYDALRSLAALMRYLTGDLPTS